MAEQELIKDDMEDDVRAAMATLSGDKPADAVETKPAEVAAEPVEKAAETKADDKVADTRERDEHGRFKAKDGKPDETKPEGDKAPAAEAGKGDVAAAPAATDAPKAGAETGATAAPPSSWSVPAKAAWDQLPAEVRDAIAKREAEVSSGFAQYKELQGLKPFADMATQSGTTLSAALDNYTKLDFAIQQDPAKGLTQLAQAMRWSQAQAAEFFATAAQQLGHKLTSAAPQPGAGDTPAGPGNVDPQLAQMFGPMLQQHLAPHLEKITGLEKTLQQRTEADQTARQQQADAIVAEFAADPKNRYYANLESEVAALLTTGLTAGGALVKVQRTGDLRRDLQAAYDQACKLHPEVSAQLSKAQRETEERERKAKEKEAAEKAKKASASLTGNRMPGSTVKVEQPGGGATDDIEADVRAAMRSLQA